ncbi:MAG: rSAM-modified peptide [bacterium]|nr:rSAM-modified peptide [bacterium]
MKAKLFVKKLVLKKETVSNLEEEQMKTAKGGGLSIPPYCSLTRCGCGGGGNGPQTTNVHVD